jgi:hypothetical protein
VGYFVRKAETGEGNGLVLVRREDFYLNDDLQEGGISVPVADRLAAFKVEFLAPGFDPNASEVPWQDRWNSDEQPSAHMPAAIRVTIGRLSPSGKSLSDSLEFNLSLGGQTP